MSTPKLLSREDVESATLAVTTYPNEKWDAAQVARLLGHIAALEADLARLKPSGQVKEDEALIRDVLPRAVISGPPGPGSSIRPAPHQAALSRIASQAQGYEVAVADNAALLKRLGDIQAMAFSLRIDGHDGDEETGVHDPDCGRCARDAIEAAVADAISGPHPGAALLEVMHEIRQYQHRDEPNLLTTLKRLLEERASIAHRVTSEQHRRALIRARNEGLDLARRKARELAAQCEAESKARKPGPSADGFGMAGMGCLDVANAITALKEKEE